MSFQDKVVIVTGAGMPTGIGAGIARCFADEGATLVLTDLDGAPLEATAAELPGEAVGRFADASRQASMRSVAEAIAARFGRIDVLVNNAGVGGPLTAAEAADENPVDVASDEDWDRQLASNLRTTYASSAAIKPYLCEGGSIVNIASIAALSPSINLPAYGAAKAGVVHLTKTLAVELAPRRIRVNCICPGLLWTRAWELLATRLQQEREEFATMTPRQVFEAVVGNTTPLGVEQTPEDIGHLAAFYASDRARMITGQVVAVDGGISVA